jgi:hypothetical protein
VNNIQVHSSLLNILLHDEDGSAATPSAKNHIGHAKTASEPPPEPGETPDKDRARRPPLLDFPQRHK